MSWNKAPLTTKGSALPPGNEGYRADLSSYPSGAPSISRSLMELRDGWGNAVMRMLGIVQEDQLHVKLEELTTYRALGGEWSVHDHCHRLFQEMEAIRLERARYGLGAHGFVSLHARTPFFFNWSTKLIRELFCRYPIGI